jgi:hypothetical protein
MFLFSVEMEIPEHKNPHEKPFREQMMKKNCWEFKNCGRQNGGSKVREFEICPVATDSSHQGKNGGLNSGRYCWKVAGTLCGGKFRAVLPPRWPIAWPVISSSSSGRKKEKR